MRNIVILFFIAFSLSVKAGIKTDVIQLGTNTITVSANGSLSVANGTNAPVEYVKEAPIPYQ